MRSRASDVARLKTVAAPFIFNSRLFVRFVHVEWTCDAGRAGAHPLLATKTAPLDGWEVSGFLTLRMLLAWRRDPGRCV
jgi:hypothetical protein